MISEQICMGVLRSLHGRKTTVTYTWHPGQENEEVRKSTKENASAESDLIRPLMAHYELSDIDAAIRWLRLGGYLGETYPFGRLGPFLYVLSKKGAEAARRRAFPEEDRRTFYHVDPHSVFIAHQFNADDEELVQYIRGELLEKNGFTVLEGKADGLEEFRHAIMSKIRKARFFLCLLTKHSALESGLYVSSVWLYQEIGAAMALGKSPLLLVEEEIDPEFVGELQKVYEYVPFTRSNHPRTFQTIIRRIKADLKANLIPLPEDMAAVQE